MGIPGFFSFLKKYNNIYNDDIDDNFIRPHIVKSDQCIDDLYFHLFLDFNGAIYTAYYSKTIKTEKALIANVLGYLDLLVSIYDKCKLKTLFIALDGVPPRAKIEQQRMRRFHSVKEKRLIKEMEERWGERKESNLKETDNIDTTMITPGTQFMYNLRLAIEKHIQKYKQINTVIFSSADVPGEGEHKIMKYIKTIDYKDYDNIVIYGLDGDLIMLSLASHINNIYLLREKTFFGSYTFEVEGYEFMYLDIDALKMCLIDEFTNYISNVNYDNMMRLIDDYVFLTFIIGNDFIPKIPHLSVYNNGLDTLMKSYCRLYNHHREFLIDCNVMKINYKLVFCLFEDLADSEEKMMQTYHYRRKRKRINMRDIDTEIDRRKQLLKYLPLQYLNVEEVINPNNNGWQERYYDICFHTNCCKSDIVKQYLQSLVWTFHYYFKDVISWDWFYSYQYGPLVEDIKEYLIVNKEVKKRIKISYDINKLKNEFKLNKPIKQQELLLMVLPIESKKYMVNRFDAIYKKNDIIRNYFPDKYRIAIPYHSMFWECHPILPIIDINVIKKELKTIYLTKDEQQRNQIASDFVIKN